MNNTINKWNKIKNNSLVFKIGHIIQIFLEIPSILPLSLLAIIAGYCNKPIQIGLGPEPLINNIYHKKSLERYGYSAETFVNEVYYVTENFDIRYDLICKYGNFFKRIVYGLFCSQIIFIKAIFRYQALYFYFNGCCLYNTYLLWRIEPGLYKIARVKTVIMPYGSDVQDLTRCPNLLFRHTMSISYPIHRMRRNNIAERIDLWTQKGDHIISGCDWVYYMYYWDTLTLGHFSIDTKLWQPSYQAEERTDKKIRILHAPNHREIKGTKYFIKAIEELQKEGLPIEFQILEKVPNYQIRAAIEKADIVADQLIVGWYAMFAIEAMTLQKPVLCYINKDLEELYINAGLLKKDELPIIRCDPLNVKEIIRELVQNYQNLSKIGQRSREYVLKHHSIEKIGMIFDSINRKIGLKPILMVDENW